MLSQLDDQVDDNTEVHDQDGDAQQAVFLHDLVDLEWNQRAGGEDDEVSGPVALEDQADSLDQVQDARKRKCLPGSRGGAIDRCRSSRR